MNEAQAYKNIFDRAADSNIRPVIAFGSYPSSKDGIRAPVIWKILEEKDGKALLIAGMCIDALPYDEKHDSTTWEKCSLRKYMNSVMINDLFTPDEQKLLVPVVNQNPDSIYFHAKGGEPSNGGRPTEDTLFLISSEEAERYFGNEKRRSARATAYAGRKCKTPDENSSAAYWLRGPGMRGNLACYVKTNGAVEYTGYHTDCADMGIRPAVWVDFSDPEFSRLMHIRLQNEAERAETYKNETKEEPRKYSRKPALAAGLAGIAAALIAVTLILISANISPVWYFILGTAAATAGIAGIAICLRNIKRGRGILVLCVCTLALGLLVLGTAGYFYMSHIWDLSQYL